MKVLVTGGGGFIGAWIVRRLLAAGAEVRLFDMSGNRATVEAIAGEAASACEWIRGDICDGAQVADALAGCTHVIHMAAVLTPACQADPAGGARINVIGTLNVFEAAIRHGIDNVIYTSSVSVFGPDNGTIPEPTTLYGAYKLANEGCARSYWVQNGVSSVGFRINVVYGPGREVGLSAGPSLACRAAARNEGYTIGFNGETGLIYVGDVAATYVEALLNPAEGAHVYNISGPALRMEDIIAEIRKHNPTMRLDAAGDPLPFYAGIPTADLFARYPDLRLTSLSDGIARTVAHYASPDGNIED